MDDLFGMLYGNLPPTRKLLAAVSSNMTHSVTKLLRDSVDVNAVVIEQNGHTALHVACERGFHECVKCLLVAGANPDQEDRFGRVPIHIALRQSHVECVRLLINTGSSSSDPRLVWIAEVMSGAPVWLGYSLEMCKLLLKATPALGPLPSNKLLQFYERYLSGIPDKEMLKLYFVSGNKVPSNEMKSLMTVADEDMKLWLTQMQKVQTLQMYARNEIRKHLRPNVFVSLKHLPLPQKVKEYLLFEDEL